MDFEKTYSTIKDSKEFSGLKQTNVDKGSFKVNLNGYPEIKFIFSPKGSINVFYPFEYGILFWYKIWHSKLKHVLCSKNNEPIKYELKSIQDIGKNDKLLPPDIKLRVQIDMLEKMNKIPRDPFIHPEIQSNGTDYYSVKFFKAACDWKSDFPPAPMGSDENIKKNKDFSNLPELQKSVDNCPKCGKGQIIIDSEGGELLCDSCGSVVKEKIEETEPEWRTFSLEERNDRSRTGMSSLAMHDMGLGTEIGIENRDKDGKSLPTSIRSTVERLRIWDGRSKFHKSADKNLRKAFSELDRLTEKLSLENNIKEDAAYIYRKALERGLVRGRSISVLIATSIYLSCRITETPITLKMIVKISNLKQKNISRCFHVLVQELNLKIPLIDANKYVSRITSKLGLSEITKRKALEIIKKVPNNMILGKDQMGVVAAALYAACVIYDEQKTQKELAEAANVSELTVRNRYKDLKKINIL